MPSTEPTRLWSVQFSKDGNAFLTLQKFGDKELAESVMKACAGYGSEFQHPYWRVRQANQQSKDFHAVISDD